MKKILYLTLVLYLLSSVAALAAGVVSQMPATISDNTRTITFTCIADSAAATIPNTDTNSSNTAFIKGWYLYSVEAFPTTGGTAPDAADVMIYDADGLDLLGSEDGGTTAYAGLALIHATLKRRVLPNLYLPRAGLHVNFAPIITGALTLDVDNQATNSANFTVVLTFVR